ncbi:YesL family protein [Paucisalibacillus sp. EB02]|uniref:YesL family protein n=1 Tax=Paucisalibacillus sp. EB02 TaxID=1347087 RepID=UPI0004B166CB|nr:DUF624 domain-containing protein [Paucisalibacillus sp. EB02]
MGGWDKFYLIANWMLRIAYLNILWIFFTFVGFVFFGIFPATSAMFSITRKWIFHRERNIKLFKTFWTAYKQDFLKQNGYGLIFLLVGYFIYYDITFIQLNPGQFQFLVPVIVLIFAASIITLLFFFPVFVHFKLSFFQYLKQAFLIGISSILELIGMIATIFLLYGMIVLLPGTIPLFTGSVLAIAITFLSQSAFKRIAFKKGIQIDETSVG